MSAERELLVTPLAGVKTRRQRWAYQDFVPIGVPTILAGRGGIGKSTILAWLTAALTTGTLAGDFAGKPVPVGFISGEDDAATTLVPRLQAAGADLELVQDFSAVRTTTAEGQWTGLPNIAEDLLALKTSLQEWGTKVLIIDPIMSMMSGDSIKASDVRRNLDPIASLAAELGIAPILVMHFGKGAGNASDKVSGSHAFRDIARSVLLLAVDDETGERILTVDKSNYSQNAPSLAFEVVSATVMTDEGEDAIVGRAHLIGESQLTVHEIVRRGNDEALGNDTKDIIACINDHPEGIAIKDLVDELDLPRNQLRVYLGRLVNAERIVRLERGKYGPIATRNNPVTPVASVASVAFNHPIATQITDATPETAPNPVAKVNGVCPNCGNPSHWANASAGYVHPECEVVA
jgi:AAA domain